MPPKRKNKGKIAKNGDSDLPIGSAAQRKLDSASTRAQARASNLTFLQEALNAAKTDNQAADYSNSGHVFVAVDQANSSKSFGQDGLEECDPLNLSQKGFAETLEAPSPIKQPIFFPQPPSSSFLSAPSTHSLPGSPKFLPPASSSSVLSAPVSTSRSEQPLAPLACSTTYLSSASSSSMLPASVPTTRSTQPLAQSVTSLPPSSSLLQAPSTQSFPAPPSGSSPKTRTLASSVSPSRTLPTQILTVPLPEPPPLPIITMSLPRSPLQSSDDSTDDTDQEDVGKDEKYAKLLAKNQKQAEQLKASRKKTARFKLQMAEMKDLVVHAVAEAKKAKTGENTKTTFQLDPDVNMTVAQIENINSISNNVGSFAQNLALHMYGAENLRERSVTGRSCNRMKNTDFGRPARPGFSPKKLQFIYSKARERVVLEVGASNLGQIKTLSHESLINKAIGEKIANLRKAAKNAEGRRNNNAA